MARHRPEWLDVDREASSFVTLVERGEKKTDDLLYKVTVRNLRRNIAEAGFSPYARTCTSAGWRRGCWPNRFPFRAEGTPVPRHPRHEHGAPAGNVASASMKIIITIDTEGDNQWDPAAAVDREHPVHSAVPGPG